MLSQETSEEILIYGISKPFEKLLCGSMHKNISIYWFREIDTLYFSKKKYLIILSEDDLAIIRRSKECYDKLKALSFQKHVTLKTCSELSL
jgi:hypothetical protein